MQIEIHHQQPVIDAVSDLGLPLSSDLFPISTVQFVQQQQLIVEFQFTGVHDCGAQNAN